MLTVSRQRSDVHQCDPLCATPDGNVIDNGGTRFTLAGLLGDATSGQGGNVVFSGSAPRC